MVRVGFFPWAVCFRMRLDYNIPKQMQAEALEVIDKAGGFWNPMGNFSGLPWLVSPRHHQSSYSQLMSCWGVQSPPQNARYLGSMLPFREGEPGSLG